MTQLAAITAKRAMMFITRMVLSMMKPGPARDLLKNDISEEKVEQRSKKRLPLRILKKVTVSVM